MLDHLDGPSVITRVFVGRQEGQSERRSVMTEAEVSLTWSHKLRECR
jgi:hypothetical protein